uniref:Uncharacterized protein n=1 Tax=Ramularia collo-cygni TaxID=112498 RepID=A0A2D3ULG2_9PEZI
MKKPGQAEPPSSAEFSDEPPSKASTLDDDCGNLGESTVLSPAGDESITLPPDYGFRDEFLGDVPRTTRYDTSSEPWYCDYNVRTSMMLAEKITVFEIHSEFDLHLGSDLERVAMLTATNPSTPGTMHARGV